MDRGDSTLKSQPQSSLDTVKATPGPFPLHVTVQPAGRGPRGCMASHPGLGARLGPPFPVGPSLPLGPPQPLSLSVLRFSGWGWRLLSHP